MYLLFCKIPGQLIGLLLVAQCSNPGMSCQSQLLQGVKPGERLLPSKFLPGAPRSTCGIVRLYVCMYVCHHFSFSDPSCTAPGASRFRDFYIPTTCAKIRGLEKK